MKFTASRNLRLVIFLIIIIYGTYYICNLVAGDHYDKVDNSETYTTYCIQKRPEIVDIQRITDLNCSLEKGRKRIYVSLSDEGLDELKKNLPFALINLKCNPISVSLFTQVQENKNTSEDAEKMIMSYAKLHNYERLCQSNSHFEADELSLEYMNKNNQPTTIINFKFDKN